MFRGSVKGTGYPLHSSVPPFNSPPVRHRAPSHFNWTLGNDHAKPITKHRNVTDWIIYVIHHQYHHHASCFKDMIIFITYCTATCVGRVAHSIVTELRAGRSGFESRSGTKFSARPDRPWGPPSLLYNGYRVFPWGKMRPGRVADHSTPF